MTREPNQTKNTTLLEIKERLTKAKDELVEYDRMSCDLMFFYKKQDEINAVLSIKLAPEHEEFLAKSLYTLQEAEAKLEAIYEELDARVDKITEELALAKHSLKKGDIIDCVVEATGEKYALFIDDFCDFSHCGLAAHGRRLRKSGDVGKRSTYCDLDSGNWSKRSDSAE